MWLRMTWVLALALIAQVAIAGTVGWHEHVARSQAAYPGKSGLYLLERGEDALVSRAWLADNSIDSIDVQYFIWSEDNIGTLAAAALLRAAERGVRVRVIVDDFLIDTDNEVLYALAAHPNVGIRIYNPNLNVGTSLLGKVFNTTVRFRDVNQRMHNKLVIFDRQALITGGRNMADEYYDFDHEYNFRDRDVLLVGDAVSSASTSFEAFWDSELAVPIEDIIDNPFDQVSAVTEDVWGDEIELDRDVIDQQRAEADLQGRQRVYDYLTAYEKDTANYDDRMRDRIGSLDDSFRDIVEELVWVKARFISDDPGKNDRVFFLGGGGISTDELARAIQEAKERIVIQTPYLITSFPAWRLLSDAVDRGVRVRINTNSLGSTDNLLAYSGYSRQRNRLLNSGMEIYEFRPDAALRSEVNERYEDLEKSGPIFSLHAKTMVIDGKSAYIGSFNLDPRSENLNTISRTRHWRADWSRRWKRTCRPVTAGACARTAMTSIPRCSSAARCSCSN